MPANETARDLTLLREAAETAATIANRYWRTDQIVTEKAGGAGPVSEGDLAVDRYLRKALTAARPDYGWLSEESDHDPRRAAARRCFVVDPIDGTRAYVGGRTTWALSLAVVEDGRPLAGIVLLPQRGKLYAAAQGTGATLNGAPIRVATAGSADGVQVLAPKTSLAADLWPGGLPDLTRHFRPSLAYRLCLVAEGRFDAMLTLRPTWDWDIAAGVLIAAQAGAGIAAPSGADLRFNTPEARNPGVLVAAPPLLADLLTRLAPPAKPGEPGGADRGAT